MNRRQFTWEAASSALLVNSRKADQKTSVDATQILPGIWRLRFGMPDEISPVKTRHYAPAEEGLSRLASVSRPPFDLSEVTGSKSARGYVVSLPLAEGELPYGLGLQLKSFLQRGLKKKLRVNADPKMDTGDTHAPVPFYVTTAGYGVLIDTARYATFYCGDKVKKSSATRDQSRQDLNQAGTLPAQYSEFHAQERSRVLVEIPRCQGVDAYIFAGPSLSDAISRYNLFAGGGALPPRWGLGFWYRCFQKFTQEEVLKVASSFRDSKLPCDVLGLEPGWQTHAYSCSFVWSERFPDPGQLCTKLSDLGYRLNLWEHAFTHPTSPLYKTLFGSSGDYQVWDGLVPDFLSSDARKTFAQFHDQTHVAVGVSGYKLDECDNSDFTGNWSFPELSRFPSGADGEQMHSLFGLRYQDAIQSIFEGRNQRTLGLVRSSQALAAPYPYVLYSDLYDHKDFIRALVNSGFSGLLWCPEVRDAVNGEDLIRRLQTVIFSPLAMINAWYIQNPPWKQVDQEKNNASEFAENWQELEAACRLLIELRMKLVPYLYAAFVRYHLEGRPPFRALVVDYPADKQTYTIDDQYLVGDYVLVAPVVAGEQARKVYLPEGRWWDFWTNKPVNGGQILKVDVAIDRVPVFVKDGAILPLAKVSPHTGDPRAFEVDVLVYGDKAVPFVLFEDNGQPNPKFSEFTLSWDGDRQSGSASRRGPKLAQCYSVSSWRQIRG